MINYLGFRNDETLDGTTLYNMLKGSCSGFSRFWDQWDILQMIYTSFKH